VVLRNSEVLWWCGKGNQRNTGRKTRLIAAVSTKNAKYPALGRKSGFLHEKLDIDSLKYG
jgi:hypothetical protein